MPEPLGVARLVADPSATDRDKEASCNRLLHDTIANLHRSFPRNLTWGCSTTSASSRPTSPGAAR